jgi:lysophospholipase L1-like esterase
MNYKIILAKVYFLGLVILLMSCSVTNNAKETNGCDFALYPPSDTVITTHDEWTQSHYKNRIKYFKQDSILPNSIVMLGNSLTEQGGNWGARLNIDRVSNRGIAGDNSDGVLARLGEIKCAQPDRIFLMIGTNDLWTNYSVEKVASNIESIGNELATSLPETQVYVQTIMPLEEGHNQTERLMDINELLRSIENSPYTLLDTFEEMSGDSNHLPASYTTDGVHLTNIGYNKWASIIRPYLGQD